MTESKAGHEYTNGAALDADHYLRLDSDAAVQVEAQAEPGRRFRRLTLTQVLAMPPKQWLIDQVIGAGDLAMIYGAPGSGKTFVGLDLAFAAALGKSFAGRFAVERPLTVAYAAGEGGSGLAQRFQAAAEYYGVEDSDVAGLYVYTDAPQLYSTSDPCNAGWFVNEYLTDLEAGEVESLDLLILDTLHSVTAGADENSSQHMGVVLNQVKSIADRLGCAVILVHHTNKAGTGERGSSSLRGAMDCMIEVKTLGSGRLIACDKLKDGEAWKPQTFDLIAKADSVRVDWGEVGTGESRSSKRAENTETLQVFLMDNPGRGFAAKHLCGLIAGSETDVHKAMKPLVESGKFSVQVADGSDKPSRGNPLLWAYTGGES